MTDWQPISTAPKDGTRILGCSESNYDCEIVWFGACDTLGLTDAEAEEIPEETFWFESWWTNTEFGAVRLESEVVPTGWMPCPPPRSEWREITEDDRPPNDIEVLMGCWESWPENKWRVEYGFYGSTKGGWIHGRMTHWLPSSFLPSPPSTTPTHGRVA